MHIQVVERDNCTPRALLRDRGPVQRPPLPLPDLLPRAQAHCRVLPLRRQPAHADQDVNARFQRGPRGLLLQARQPPPNTARPEACGRALQAGLGLDLPELNQELAGTDQQRLEALPRQPPPRHTPASTCSTSASRPRSCTRSRTGSTPPIEPF